MKHSFRRRGAGSDADSLLAYKPTVLNLIRAIATFLRRLELELFGLPTTMTTSHCPASALTASCRFWVA